MAAMLLIRHLNGMDLAVNTFDGLGSHSADCSGDTAPFVMNTIPVNGATNVAVDTNLEITFSEAVNVTGQWFSVNCTSSGVHSAAFGGGAQTYSLNPDTDFAFNESCTVSIFATNISDQDGTPNNMASDYFFSFYLQPHNHLAYVVTQQHSSTLYKAAALQVQ